MASQSPIDPDSPAPSRFKAAGAAGLSAVLCLLLAAITLLLSLGWLFAGGATRFGLLGITAAIFIALPGFLLPRWFFAAGVFCLFAAWGCLWLWIGATHQPAVQFLPLLTAAFVVVAGMCMIAHHLPKTGR